MFVSCNISQKNINECLETKSIGHLVCKGEVSFPLDSVTTYFLGASEYNSKNGIYSFLFDRKLLFYNYETQKLLKKINIDVGNPTSYTIINEDSIVVLDYETNEVVLLNSDGNTYDKLKISPTIPYYPFPVTKIAPLRLNDNELVFWGNMSGEYMDEDCVNRRVMGKFNLTSHAVSYKIPYSSVYGNANWGGGLFRWIYADYNPRIRAYIVSFPVEHYLFVVSEDGDILERVYAGSHFIDVIESLPKSKMIPLDADVKTRFFVENHSYANVLYDSYRDLYYRIAEQKCEYKNAIGWQKKISVIILNNRFEKIGETLIDKCDLNYR